jgi:hypothetical protein
MTQVSSAQGFLRSVERTIKYKLTHRMRKERPLTLRPIRRPLTSHPRRKGRGSRRRRNDPVRVKVVKDGWCEFLDELIDLKLKPGAHRAELVELLLVAWDDGEE